MENINTNDVLTRRVKQYLSNQAEDDMDDIYCDIQLAYCSGSLNNLVYFRLLGMLELFIN